ncbi:tripartite tricarboxylate transporter substrate binding protein [Alcaligenaceae bacterium]|nr:tripartite tricarboxylate transporter substrate binding protein [Alcaligenaceae bacterium]
MVFIRAVRQFVKFVLLTVFSLSAFSAVAAYPDRAIKMVVPFPPGGGTDKLARLVSKQVADTNGWNIVVENRPGAEGNIALDAVAKAPADGYTLLFGQLDNMSLNAALFEKLPFDPFKDFRSIGLLVESPSVFVVAKDSRFNSFDDAIQEAKKEPKALSFAFPSTSTRMLVELAQKAGGVQFLTVPYKGAAQALPDLMGGHIQLYVGSTQTLQSHIKSGSVRALAVTSKSRVNSLPDVPTVAEQGLPSFDAANIWWGVAAPAGVSDEIVNLLNAKFNEAVNDPEIRQKIEADGGLILGGAPEEMTNAQKRDYDKLLPIIRDIGMKVD